MPNWLTMLIELVIGGVVASLFFIIQQKQGKKIQAILDERQNFHSQKYSEFITQVNTVLNSTLDPITEFYNQTQENQWEAEWNTNWKRETDYREQNPDKTNTRFLNDISKKKQEVLNGKLAYYKKLLKPQYYKYESIWSLLNLSETVLNLEEIIQIKKITEDGKQYCKEWEKHILNDSENRTEPNSPDQILAEITNFVNMTSKSNLKNQNQ